MDHWRKIIIEKNGGTGAKLDFMKEFKKLMDLPSDYELTQTQLFRMFLKELQVRADYPDAHRRGGKLTENIDQLCRQTFRMYGWRIREAFAAAEAPIYGKRRRR